MMGGLGLAILKTFADNKINMTQRMNFVCKRVKITVGKGENDSYQHFLLFPYCFQKDFFPWIVKI